MRKLLNCLKFEEDKQKYTRKFSTILYISGNPLDFQPTKYVEKEKICINLSIGCLCLKKKEKVPSSTITIFTTKKKFSINDGTKRK